mgnify:CR=1 FL=1
MLIIGCLGAATAAYYSANGATTNGATKVLENGHKIELALERDPPPSEEDVEVEV